MLLSRNGINMRLGMSRVFVHQTSLQCAIGGASRDASIIPHFSSRVMKVAACFSPGVFRSKRNVASWTHGTVALRAVCPLVVRGRGEDWRHAPQVQPSPMLPVFSGSASV